MADTGWVIAGTGTNVTVGGDLDWTTPGNITADDGSVAQMDSEPRGNETTQVLQATNFGLSANIPDGSTIIGIEARIERRDSDVGLGGEVADLSVQLDTATQGQGATDNKADTVTAWPGTLTAVDYGGASDLWGAGSLSRADVIASTFGVRLRAQEIAGDATGLGEVDFIAVKVHFATSGASTLAPHILKRRVRR